MTEFSGGFFMVATLVLTVIFMIPIYFLLIWTWCEPEDSILLGRRWMYKEEPEISKKAIRDAKFVTMTIMIGLPFVLLSIFLDIAVLKVSWVVLPVVLVIGRMKISANDSDS